MAKSVVVNKLGNRRFTMYIPSTAQNANDFLNLLDGEWDIYELQSSEGNETVSGEYKHCTVMIQDETTHKKQYMSFYMKATKNEDDVVSALQGRTFNGIKADVVYVLNLTWLGSSSDNGGNG